MSSILCRTLVIFVLAFVPGSSVHASDPAGGAKVEPFFGPLKARRQQDLTRAFVQRAPDFSLQVAGNRVSPNMTCLIYHGERVEGDQLLLSAQGTGFRGWASVSDVVPFTEADAFFSQQIVHHPGDSFGFLMRGLVRFANDDRDHALADLNEALRLEPKNVAALTTRANLWLFKNRPDQAVADANKAVEIDPRNSYAVEQRAIIYCSVKEDDKALRDIERAIDLGSQSSVIYIGRGQVYWKRGELAKAKIELDHALRIDPERADAILFLAAIHMLQSEPDKAMSAVTKAIQIDPKCDTCYALRAVLNRSLGKVDQALADLNEAVRLASENASHIRNRGAVKFERGEYDSAIADIETAIRIDPNNEEVLYGRAWILATCPVPRIRNGAQAMVSATRLCELTKWKKPEYLYTLAIAYSETGDFAAAIKWQQKAIDMLATNDPVRHEYMKLLKRYKANKPYHRLGLLEEIGLKSPSVAAKTSARNPG